MSKVFIEEETLIGIGNAIREKSGTTDLIATTDMASAISNLPTGGGGTLKMVAMDRTSSTGTGTITSTYDVSPYAEYGTIILILYSRNYFYTFELDITNQKLVNKYYNSYTTGDFTTNRNYYLSSPTVSFSNSVLTFKASYAGSTKATIFYAE